MKVKLGELLTPLIVFLFVAIYYSQIHDAPLEAGGWPKVLLLLSVVFCVPVVWQCFKRGAQEEVGPNGLLAGLCAFLKAQKKESQNSSIPLLPRTPYGSESSPAVFLAGMGSWPYAIEHLYQ